MSIFEDVGRAAMSLPKQVASATTGRRGLFGKKGTLSLLTQGKVQKAVAATGKAVSKVTNNALLQGSFPGSMVPAAILSGAVGGGAKGALAATKKVANNPIIKAELAVLGMVFPPLAPASAGAIAAMEATSRVVDGIRSKDPKKIAGAAMQIAATQLAAKSGNPGAQRALNLLKDTDAARKVALGKKGAGVVDTLRRRAKSGDKKAGRALELVQHAALRNAAKVAASSSAPPKKKAAARKLLTTAQRKRPGLTAGVLAALNSPKGVRVGDFALLRTGRILYKGKPVRRAKK